MGTDGPPSVRLAPRRPLNAVRDATGRQLFLPLQRSCATLRTAPCNCVPNSTGSAAKSVFNQSLTRTAQPGEPEAADGVLAGEVSRGKASHPPRIIEPCRAGPLHDTG